MESTIHRKVISLTFLKRHIAAFLIFCSIPAFESRGSSYEIRHYDLRIEPDFRSKTLLVEAQIVIDNADLDSVFEFGLNDAYQTVSVSCAETPVRTERGEGAIGVLTPSPVHRLTLHFSLHGKPGSSVDERRDVIDDSSLFLLWSDRFYPIDFDRWATVTTQIVLPPGFQAVAPGTMTSCDTAGIAMTVKYVSEIPIVSFSVFADRRWISTDRTINGIAMKTLLYPGSERFRDQIFRTSASVIDFYSRAMCPYPFEQFTFITMSDIYARRAFPGFIAYSPRYLEQEFTTTGHDAHETALLWWTYTTHGTGPGSFQWTEGFGDYAEIQYAEACGQPLPSVFQKFREDYLATPGDQDVPYTDLRGSTPQKFVHGKYPWMMHLLRYVVGDTAFSKGMRLLFDRYKHRSFTFAEFISALEDGCGKDLTWWRSEWVERKGVPDIGMKSEVKKFPGGSTVSCTLVQRGNIYHLPLEIGYTTNGAAHIERVTLSEREQVFTFAAAAVPSHIELDPNHWILMKRFSVQ